MESTLIKSGPSHSEGPEPSSTAGRAASSVASARDLLEERAHAAAAALTEKMRTKAAEREAEKARKAAEKEAEKAAKAAEREAAKAAREAEREAAKAAKEAEKEAARHAREEERAAKKAAKEALPKRPRGRPPKAKVAAAAAAADDDESDMLSVASEEEGPAAAAAAPAPALLTGDVDGLGDSFADLKEPSPRPTTPMRHIASLQAENAALRARLERMETTLRGLLSSINAAMSP